jgi:beta-aspartyl-peptidase (threonine type)
MILLVHAGAGHRRSSNSVLKKLPEVLKAGYGILKSGGSSLDAVVHAIIIMEDCGLFNAGAGGVPQMDGIRRLDASVMDGSDLRTGAVIGLEGIRNPIHVARTLMDLPNTMLTNAGARKIAEKEGIARLPHDGGIDRRRASVMKKPGREFLDIYSRYFSTVGAIACDEAGNLAAGTSTGGITDMLPGRVGDSPVIGAGTYAENHLGAVSCTGSGEHILRLALAKEICMQLKGKHPTRAAAYSLQRLLKIGGGGGVIVLDSKGRIAVVHTTPFMPAGFVTGKGITISGSFSRVKL